ncbi:hypothetical protein L195_g014356, partial [Trifolium pratense]
DYFFLLAALSLDRNKSAAVLLFRPDLLCPDVAISVRWCDRPLGAATPPRVYPLGVVQAAASVLRYRRLLWCSSNAFSRP